MIRSGRTASDCSPGDRFSHCRRWADAASNFEDVVVVERRSARVAVEVISGPERGDVISVYASTLWAADQLDHAQQMRNRDLRIQEIDDEQRVDDVTWTAIEICCLLATGDIAVDGLDAVRTVLRRLGRSDDLDNLHEMAYVEDDSQWATVYAPRSAWRDLFESFAQAEPELVEQQVADATADWRWIDPPRRAAALAIVRSWAGLAPVARPIKVPPAPRLMADKRRIERAVRQAAKVFQNGSDAAESLNDLHGAYRRAREEPDDKDASISRQVFAPSVIRDYVMALVDDADTASMGGMKWLLDVAGVRTGLCDHIVWSDYSAQHPRTLHLFPDGHLYHEEDGVSRRTPNALTVCEHRVVLNWRSRSSWQRAYRGEWLDHYEALQRHRADVWRREAEGQLNAGRFAAGYDEARRICQECAALHGLFLECFEKSDEPPLWSPWRLAEIRQSAIQRLDDELRQGRLVKSVKQARGLACGARLHAETEVAAREAKRRGPGPLRRLFGAREERSPSMYEQWAEICEGVGLEPHELISQDLWHRLLAEGLAEHVVSSDAQGSERFDFPRTVRAVVEARLAGLGAQ